MATAVTQEEASPIAETLTARTDWRLGAEALILFALCLGLFSLIQFSTPDLVGIDGYYHARMADVMRQQGIRPDFPWLPLTILSPEKYYDHHLLYHVAVALFIPGDPLRPVPDTTLIQAAKSASVVIPALAFMAIWWLLRRQGVPWAWLWAAGLFAVSEAFLFRMSMVRAQAASLLVLALAVHWLLRGQHAWLIPLGFLYVWLYNAFPLLMVVAGVLAIAIWMTERQFEWRALAYPALGIALGLIINPYFPANVAFIVNHLVPKIGEPISGLGVEWDPYQTWTLVRNSPGMLVALAAGVFALGWSGERMDRPSLGSLGLVFVFGFMLLKSRRFIEYAPPFALIFAALASGPLLKRWAADRRWRLAIPAALALMVLGFGVYSVYHARKTVSESTPGALLADASHWLAEHTEPGTMIFQTDWDDFPRLFFYNTSSVYTVGLDPTYLQIADPALYDEWVSITRGNVEQPGTAIREDFGAAYVITDLEHDAFLEQAAADPGLVEVYRDEYAAVFEVRPDSP